MPKETGLMRALGLVAGDLWKVIAGKRPGLTQKRVVRKAVQEHEVPMPEGKVVLRRTTVDEVEVRREPRP